MQGCFLDTKNWRCISVSWGIKIWNSKANSGSCISVSVSLPLGLQTLSCLTFFVNGHHSYSGKQARFCLQQKIAVLCSSKQKSLDSTSEYGALFSFQIVLNLGPCIWMAF